MEKKVVETVIEKVSGNVKISFDVDGSDFSVSEPHQCQPCLRDKMTATANVYCSDCGELLCPECTKHHRKNKSSVEHKLCELRDDVRDKFQLDYLSNITKCWKHPKEEINYICVDHDRLCCTECAILEHRQCTRIISIADEQNFTVSLEDVKQDIEKLKYHVAALLAHECRHITLVKESENQIKAKLAEVKAEIDRTFIVIKQEIEDKSRNKRAEILSSCETNIQRHKHSKTWLEILEDKLGALTKFGQKRHQFLVSRDVAKDMKEKKASLEQNHSATTKEVVTLAGDVQFRKELDRCLRTLLDAKTTKITVNLPSFPNIKSVHDVVKGFKSTQKTQSQKARAYYGD